MSENKIKLETSAKRFGEALPLGNGHIGAMIYGTVPMEKIVFTENTFFSGEKNSERNHSGAAEAFQGMREAAQKGDYDRVHQEAEKFIGERGNYGTALPVGALYVNYESTNGSISLKERSLDIEEGVATCDYCDDKGCLIKEQLFLSHPDHIFAMKIQGQAPFHIDIRWCGAQSGGAVAFAKNEISFIEYANEKMHCNEKCGVTLWGKVWVLADGDISYPEDSGIEAFGGEKGIAIDRASEIYIYADMKTDFRKQAGLAPEENGRESLLQIPEKSYDVLLKRHIQDVKKHMNRVFFELEGVPEAEKLVFLYQYGRYLLFSSSREDSVLPAHLQGIWNDNVACNIGWTCDMHLDINTQMNYWIANACRLRESICPLDKWIKELLIPQGRITAEQFYGRKGWVGELVSNAFGYTNPYWATPLAPCPTGGVWLITQMWENYLYSEDVAYLQEIYPVFQQAVIFFESYVFETESGKYSCGPSVSPENSFLWKGKTYQISNGCTYEILMIRELFDIYMQMVKLLELPEDALYYRVKEKSKKLLPYRILQDGTIAEYASDFEIPDRQHRHTSHLLGVFPFSQINPIDTPELSVAAENTVMQKYKPEDGWEDTGWARSLLVLYEGRLWHGREAYYHLQAMIQNLSEPNGMIYHPPTRGAGAFDHVYELDGNTGLTMGMTEMLMQSHLGFIHLLPAVPEEFKGGMVKGLMARGNVEVSFAWRDGKVLWAEFCAKVDKQIKVRVNGSILQIQLKAGQKNLTDF